MPHTHTQKNPIRPKEITGKFFQTFKKKIRPILYKVFQKTDEEDFSKASIILQPQPDKNIRKLQPRIIKRTKYNNLRK